MKNNLLRLSYYANIISGLQLKYNVKSIIKIVFITYYVSLIENDLRISRKKYKVEKDFFEKVSMNIIKDQQELTLIFNAIHLLETSKLIKYEDGLLIPNEELNYAIPNGILESSYFKNLIIKVLSFNDITFAGEVIRYVKY